MPDQLATLRADVAVLQACPDFPAGVAVAGFLFDVHRGSLTRVV